MNTQTPTVKRYSIHPAMFEWIPAFAGMTYSYSYVNPQGLLMANAALINPT